MRKIVLSLVFFSSIIAKELPITVILPSYNNESWCEKGLQSIFKQRYDNYDVMFINDASTDQTFTKSVRYVKKMHKTDKVHFVNNKIRRGMAANVYRAIHSLPDNRIVIILDGDDKFLTDKVFLYVNNLFSHPQKTALGTSEFIWMTYGGMRSSDSLELSYCSHITPQQIHNNEFRKTTETTYHIRSFYAGVFKEIRAEDLMWHGIFIPVGADLAYYFPIYEMSGPRFHKIEQCLYYYNLNNPLNDHKINLKFQEYIDHWIRSRKRYSKRDSMYPFWTAKKSVIDMVLPDTINQQHKHYNFSDLPHCIQQCQDKIFILYNVSSADKILSHVDKAAQAMNEYRVPILYFIMGQEKIIRAEPLSKTLALVQPQYAETLNPQTIHAIIIKKDAANLIPQLTSAEHIWLHNSHHEQAALLYFPESLRKQKFYTSYTQEITKPI